MVEFFCENRFLVHYSFLALTFLLRGKADFWKIQCPGGDKNLGEIFAWGTWVKISRFNLLKTMNLKYGKWEYVSLTMREVSKYGVFSGPYFPAFGVNTVRYSISVRIQSECGEIRTRKNSVFGHFSRSVRVIRKRLQYGGNRH